MIGTKFCNKKKKKKAYLEITIIIILHFLRPNCYPIKSVICWRIKWRRTMRMEEGLVSHQLAVPLRRLRRMRVSLNFYNHFLIIVLFCIITYIPKFFLKFTSNWRFLTMDYMSMGFDFCRCMKKRDHWKIDLLWLQSNKIEIIENFQFGIHSDTMG